MLEVDRSTSVTNLQIVHGKVNALDLELVSRLTDEIRRTPETSAIVISGTGRIFCAGVDLRRVVEGGDSYVGEFVPRLGELFMALFDHPAPVIAAVNGHALAGGCVLAAAADITVMCEGRIGLLELTAGVPLPPAATEIVRAAVGSRLAHLLMTARQLSPVQAAAVGLVDEVVEPVALLDTARAHATRLLGVPPQVFAQTKRDLHSEARGRIEAQHDLSELIAQWQSHDVQTAIRRQLLTLRSA